PSGVFHINNTKVIYAKQGTLLLVLEQEHELPLHRLLEFKDMENEEVQLKDQLLYLQRKRKTGSSEMRIVAPGETLYDISQVQAIRMENLLEYNGLVKNTQLPAGMKLYLQGAAPSRSKL